MWNAGLDVAEAGIKIAGRNINNLRYTDNTIHSGTKEPPDESEKVGLKLNIQKTKIMANRWGNNGNSERLYFLGL